MTATQIKQMLDSTYQLGIAVGRAQQQAEDLHRQIRGDLDELDRRIGVMEAQRVLDDIEYAHLDNTLDQIEAKPGEAQR